MSEDEKLKAIARKIYVLSQLCEGQRFDFTNRHEEEHLNWNLSGALNEIALELSNFPEKRSNNDSSGGNSRLNRS